MSRTSRRLRIYGRWSPDDLERRLAAARRVTDPIDAFVPTADADRLMDALDRQVPAAADGDDIPQCQDDPSVAELITTSRRGGAKRDALLKSARPR